MISKRPRHSVPWSDRLRRAAGVALVTVLIVIAILPVAIFGQQIRDVIVTPARAATGETSAGMAAAGWLVVTFPVWFAGLGLLLWPRLPRVVAIGWGIVTVTLFAPVLAFVPPKHQTVDSLITGSGSAALATGLRYAYWTLPLLACNAIWCSGRLRGNTYRRGQLIVGTQDQRTRVRGAIVGIAISLVALTIATIRAS